MSNHPDSSKRKAVKRKSVKTKKSKAGRQDAGPSSWEVPKAKTGKEGKPNGGQEDGEPQSEEEKRRLWRKNTERKMKKAPRTTVRKELPKVLVALLDEAQGGSCQHAKLLFEFANAGALPDAKEQEKSQSLTELLLEKLE